MYRQIMKKSRLIQNKTKNASLPVKASIAFFIATLIQKGLKFITTPIYTRIMSKADYGTVSVFFSYLALVGTVAMFCLNYGVFNNGMLDYKENRDGFATSLLVLSNVITSVVFVLFLVFREQIVRFSSIDFQLWILMFLVFYTLPALNFWFSRQRYEYKYKLVVPVTIAIALVSSIVSIICIKFFENNVYARLFGGESILIISCIVFYILTVKKSGLSKVTKYWKRAFAFNIFVLPHYLSIYVLTSSDRIMIQNILGNEQAAFYSVAYSIGAVAIIAWTAINSSLIPFTYEQCAKQQYDKLKNISNAVLTLYGFCCVLVMLLAPELLKIMAPGQYRSALVVIPPIILGVFFQAHYSLFVNVLYYAKKPKYALISSSIAAILNLILNWFLIPRYGIVVAGCTTLVSYLVQAIINYIAVCGIGMRAAYNGKYILKLSAMVLCSWAFVFLYEENIYFSIIRYAILLIGIILIVVNRNRLISVIKTIKRK
jgi:O-antigen/teichoic acid export membrane protein